MPLQAQHSGQERSQDAFNQGVEFFEEETYSEAIKYFEVVIQADSTYQDDEYGAAIYWLGQSYKAIEDTAAALRTWRQGIVASDRRGIFHAELADAYVRNVFRAVAEDEYDRANKLYLELLEQAPELTSEEDKALFRRHAAQMAFLLPEDFLEAGEEVQSDDGPKLAAWWRRQDPEPTTDENPRLTEHLKRVAEAEDRFANRRFATGFDDRGRVYVRLGEPTRTAFLQSLWLERSVRSDASFIPDNTYWIYDHLPHEAQFLFVEDRGGFRLGTTRDLLPRQMRNNPRMPIVGLVAMRDFYRQIVKLNPDYTGIAADVEMEYEDMQEAYGYISTQDQAFLDWQDDDPTKSREWNMPGLLSQIRQTDRTVAQRREEAVPNAHSDTDPDAAPLPLETRIARFLDEGGATRTEVYWAPKPGALDPTSGLPNAEVAEQAARSFLLEAALVEFGPDYQRAGTAPRYLEAGPAETAPGSTIPVQTALAERTGELFHLALDVRQHFAGSPEETRPELLLKRGMARIDSVRALQSQGLEMSDLRPMLLPDLEAEIQLAQMAPDEMRRLAYPFRKLPTDAPLALYFEAYHLTFGENDRTRYTVEYEIRRRTERGWLRTLFQGDDEQQTATTLEREGSSRTAEELIVIDLSELEEQVDGQQLRLTVRVTDELTGQAQERQLEFETLAANE